MFTIIGRDGLGRVYRKNSTGIVTSPSGAANSARSRFRNARTAAYGCMRTYVFRSPLSSGSKIRFGFPMGDGGTTTEIGEGTRKNKGGKRNRIATKLSSMSFQAFIYWTRDSSFPFPIYDETKSSGQMDWSSLLSVCLSPPPSFCRFLFLVRLGEVECV